MKLAYRAWVARAFRRPVRMRCLCGRVGAAHDLRLSASLLSHSANVITVSRNEISSLYSHLTHIFDKKKYKPKNFIHVLIEMRKAAINHLVGAQPHGSCLAFCADRWKCSGITVRGNKRTDDRFSSAGKAPGACRDNTGKISDSNGRSSFVAYRWKRW